VERGFNLKRGSVRGVEWSKQECDASAECARAGIYGVCGEFDGRPEVNGTRSFASLCGACFSSALGFSGQAQDLPLTATAAHE
jgi:hypothetical protein